MVSFICDACGQTVKKQKVEKHYQSECRNCSVLSCIDCGKDFPGDSYVSHTSCISEAEKYQGKLYKAKDKSNKGERKQQEWLEQVRTVSGETGKQDPRIRKLLAKITSHDNVPRKEAKFKKFCENSVNVRDINLLEKLWQVFSGVKDSNPSTNGNDISQSETIIEQDDKGCAPVEKSVLDKNGTENAKNVIVKDTDLSAHEPNKANTKQKLKSKEKRIKKRKHDAETEVQENGVEVKTEDDYGKKKKRKAKREKEEEAGLLTDCSKLQELDKDEKEIPNTKEKFNWESIIKKLLKSAPDHEMSIKKLRKKVLNEFQACGGDPRPRTEQELRVLFEKKLHKNPKVKIVKERAKLCK